LNLNQIRRTLVPSIAAVALAGSLAACGSNTPAAGGGSTTDATTPAAVNNASSLTGGGSTAQGSAQVQWASDYGTAHSGVTINYNQVGSGTGRSSFEQGTYTFAGSDSYLSDPTEYAAAKKQCGADPIEVPDYVSPIAVVFNLSGVESLNLDGATIAKIFNGSITTWNDPAIAAQNKGVTLPSTAIQAVHRSDDSGTTANFTDYLAQASKGAWKSAASQTWPATSGLSGDGTSGVVTTLQGTDGSIGYVDASKAGTFGIVSVKVGTKYVMPTAAGAASDLAASTVDPAAKKGQLVYKVDRTTTDANSYPLLLVSYLIACPSYKDAKVAGLVKDYLGYVVSTAGQTSGAKAAGSAPLPANVAKQAQRIVASIK
jgi:phosphate transport system substrate-binding protein